MDKYTDEKISLVGHSSLPAKVDPQDGSFASSSSAPFQSRFASLSLHQSDKLRFMQFSPEDVHSVRNVIGQFWPSEIKSERLYGGSHEIKFRGDPWRGHGRDAIPSRIMMREIIASLFSAGWIIHQTVDITKKQNDKDTIIFRKQPTPPPACTWFAISFNKFDLLRLIGAPTELFTSFKELIMEMQLWQSEAWKDQSKNVYEFKLRGYPWSPSGEETMKTRLLALRMLGMLEQEGWSLYASLDQSEGSDETSETDTWYLNKVDGWRRGDPVFHR